MSLFRQSYPGFGYLQPGMQPPSVTVRQFCPNPSSNVIILNPYYGASSSNYVPPNQFFFTGTSYNGK